MCLETCDYNPSWKSDKEEKEMRHYTYGGCHETLTDRVTHANNSWRRLSEMNGVIRGRHRPLLKDCN